jgi:hypothetical protein
VKSTSDRDGVIAGPRRRAPATRRLWDHDHDASFARIGLTGHGSILYRSIATETGRLEEGGRVAARQRV